MEPTNQTHTAEEEAANRAAAELQRKKKRKKRLHRILFLVIVLLIAGSAYGYYRYQQYQAAQAEAEADVLALADGEALIYGEITEVVGNDITVTVDGETREYEIPVGTAVTSSLGSTTTFAKLKTGNIIGIVTQSGTDNILRIKIVQ